MKRGWSYPNWQHHFSRISLGIINKELRNWYARAANTHGKRGVASRALCILTFWWKIGDKDGYEVLSDTCHIKRKNVSVLEEPTVPSPLSTICHMDKSEGSRSRLPSSQASSRITDIPFSAAYGLFLFPLQFFSGGKPGHAAGDSTGGDAHVAGGASAGGHLPVLLLPAPVKGLSPASKACPETLWNRRLIFHAEQNENPTVTSFTSQCW